MRCISKERLNVEPMTAEEAEAKGYETHGLTGEGYLMIDPDCDNRDDRWWISEAQFNEDYAMLEDSHMDFGQAIYALKDGHCLQREGWGDKDMFIVKQIPCNIQGLIIDKIQSLPHYCKDVLKERDGVPRIEYNNQILLIHSDGKADSWTASTADIFANDWRIVK